MAEGLLVHGLERRMARVQGRLVDRTAGEDMPLEAELVDKQQDRHIVAEDTARVQGKVLVQDSQRMRLGHIRRDSSYNLEDQHPPLDTGTDHILV